MSETNQKLEDMRLKAVQGGGHRRIESQHKKGKLTARERIDILVDEGLIISIEDEIDSSVSENVINSEGKYITPGLIVFSALGLIEIGALPETIDIRSETYNAGFDPSDAFNPFSQAIRLNRSKGVTSTVNIPKS